VPGATLKVAAPAGATAAATINVRAVFVMVAVAKTAEFFIVRIGFLFLKVDSKANIPTPDEHHNGVDAWKP
jgi:hypothetical protein